MVASDVTTQVLAATKARYTVTAAGSEAISQAFQILSEEVSGSRSMMRATMSRRQAGWRLEYREIPQPEPQQEQQVIETRSKKNQSQSRTLLTLEMSLRPRCQLQMAKLRLKQAMSLTSLVQQNLAGQQMMTSTNFSPQPALQLQQQLSLQHPCVFPPP